MNKKLITAVALAACAATPLFAQNVKEGVITFALTVEQQLSISTSTKANQGTWSAGPQYYKSTSMKRTATDVIQAIAYVLHKNPGYYSSKAQLVLVQGELSGFFNLGETLGGANGVEPRTDLANGDKNFGEVFPPTGFASTTEDIVAQLATGRHFRPNPITGAWPVGHHQPWGQIFIKDPGKSGFSNSYPLCENVTFFFSFTVQECYDCFYLNSFISEGKFSFKTTSSGGPPCCTSPQNLVGNGRDKYYLVVTFDNTKNNPYLHPDNDAYAGVAGGPYPGIVGIEAVSLPGDGIIPDLLRYNDFIASGVATFNKYVLRFTLNGIISYNWNLKLINNSDVVADFIGTGRYDAYGYGFVSLACSLITGSMTINEKIAKSENCCLDMPWWDSWYGVGWNMFQDEFPLYPTGNSDQFYFLSPINTPNDLSLHMAYNEWYEARWQWPQSGAFPSAIASASASDELPAGPESVISTLSDTGYGQDFGYPDNNWTRIPSARDWTYRGNTVWGDSGDKK